MNNINLRDLFVKNKSELPESVNSWYCIYRIINLINGKSYIGQAKYLYPRFVTSLWSHLSVYRKMASTNNKSRILYNALNKYKSRNFEVEIIEQYLDESLLDEREVYWIDFYHTCIYDEHCNGYNMSYGGNTGYHFNTPESIRKRTETNYANHGGVLSINTPEAFKRSREVLFERYGSYAGRLMDPEVRIKAMETQKANHGGKLACNTWEAVVKSGETQRANHNGQLAFNTPETYETNRLNHGGVLSFHTEEGEFNQRVSTWFTNANKNIRRLRNQGSDPIIEYWWEVTQRHLDFMRDNIDLLRKDDRWTDELEDIYHHLPNEFTHLND